MGSSVAHGGASPAQRMVGALRQLLYLPLHALAAALAVVHLFWTRNTRLMRARCHRGPQVRVEDRTLHFGETLHLALRFSAAVPGNAVHSVPALFTLAAPQHPSTAPAVITVEPTPALAGTHSEGGVQTRLGIAYLTEAAAARRAWLFAWSLGYHVVTRGLRPVTPPMRVAAVMLPVCQDNSLLITRRALTGGSFNAMWVFPGGCVDEGESPEAAAERELFEETGLRVRRERPVQLVCAYQARNERMCLSYLMLIYTAQVDCRGPWAQGPRGSLTLQPKEVSAAAWLSRGDVDNMLEGRTSGSVRGVSVQRDGALKERAMPLSELRRAPDGLVTSGPGIGAGHWFALGEWRDRFALK